MDDAVHVQVKVVKLRDLVLFDDLAEARVSLAQPAIKFWHSHDGGVFKTVLVSVMMSLQFLLFVRMK